MKIRISVGLKLAFWLAFLGILGTGVNVYYAYSKSQTLLIQSSKDKLLTATQVLARRYSYFLENIVSDLQFIASFPAIQEIASQHLSGEPLARQKAHLQEIFSGFLRTHQEYSQIRFISTKDFGREVIRVDRSLYGVEVVGEDDLQEKSHLPYVYKAVALPKGEVFFSEITLNNEFGAHLGFGKPTMRIATPVKAEDGSALGVVVINVDMQGMFEWVKKEVPTDIEVIFTNQSGDYLLHPDRSKAFGFDAGRRFLVQDDIPEANAILDGTVDKLVTEAEHLELLDRPSVAAMVRVPYAGEKENRFIVMGMLTTLDHVLENSMSLRLDMIKISLAFSLVAIMIALLLARRLAKPLNDMAKAVSNFSEGNAIPELPLGRNDEIGNLARSFATMAGNLTSQFTRLHKQHEHLDYVAHHDLLTGLPNRVLFLDRLEHDVRKSKRSGLPLALMFIDIDHFKEINDTLGHHVGDMLLKEAAQRLIHCIRDTDTVARPGGDEFTVILPELVDVTIVERIALEILQKIAKPFQLDDEVVHVTASIGITFYPNDSDSADALLKHADQAMYKSKQGGRNRHSYFTQSMYADAQARMRLSNDLRHALLNNEFLLCFQPIIEMTSGDIFKAEALIRWQHPVRGIISPAEFIPLAEETGLINEIGNWVFQQSAMTVKRWRDQYHPQFQISLNKSPIQFYNPNNNHHAWFDYLKDLDISGQSICVEITEGLLLDPSGDVKEQLFAFRDAGMQVALDDFGTGYSSLSYLKKFDIDYLKIDQSFVCNLTPDSDDLALCEAIIVMAHKLNMKVIAEGIETAEQRDLLKQAGCDFGQGYLFSRPVSVEIFERLLKPRKK